MGTNRSGVQAREKRRRTRRNEIGRARFAAKQAAGAAPAVAKSKSK
jgi:hypothetical protein